MKSDVREEQEQKRDGVWVNVGTKVGLVEG